MISQITRNFACVAAVVALTNAANAASAAEKPVGTYGQLRTILAFKVPDAAVQKLLPEGWQASPPSTGPSKDANLNVAFVDQLTVQNPDGSPGETYRVAALAIPAKKAGTDATVPMVVGGFASIPSYVPGPYGVFSLASATVDRHIHTDPTGKTNVEESWEFKNDGGDAIQLELQLSAGLRQEAKLRRCLIRGSNPISTEFIGSSWRRM